MIRALPLTLAALLLGTQALSQDEAQANRLLRQAHANWTTAQGLADDDPARAQALALALRDLRAVVSGYPDSTVATLLALGEAIGGLSLAQVEAAVADAPAVDTLCERAECRLGRLDAVIARFGADTVLTRWRTEVLGELGRIDEAVAAWPPDKPTEVLWLKLATGAALAGRVEDIPPMLERLGPEADRLGIAREVARALADAGRFDAAHALMQSAPDIADNDLSKLVAAEVEAGALDAAEARIPGTPKGEQPWLAELVSAFRLAQSVTDPGADLDAVLVQVDGLTARAIDRRAYVLILAALVDAGRIDDARRVGTAAEALGKGEGQVLLAKALAGAGRLDDAQKVLMQVGSTHDRSREMDRLQSLAILSAGPEAILATTATAPATMETFRALGQLAGTAALERRDTRMRDILMTEQLRLAAEIPDFDLFELRMLSFR